MRMSVVINKATDAKNKFTVALNNFSIFQKAFFATAISLMTLALIFLNKTKNELPRECDEFEIVHGDLAASLAVVFTGNDTMTPLMMTCLYALSNSFAQYAHFSLYLDGSNLNLTGIEKERMPEFLVTRFDMPESLKERSLFYQPLEVETLRSENTNTEISLVRFKDTDRWRSKYTNKELEQSEEPGFNPLYTDLCMRADVCSTWESSILFFKDARLFSWYVTFRTLAFLEAEINSKLNTLTSEEIYHLFRLSLKIETPLTKAIDVGFGDHEIIPNQKESLKRSIIEAFSLAYQLGFYVSGLFKEWFKVLPKDEEFFETIFSSCWHDDHTGFMAAMGRFTKFDDWYYMEKVCMRSDVLSPAERVECVYEVQNRDLSSYRGRKLHDAVDDTIAQRKPSFFHAPSHVADSLLRRRREALRHRHEEESGLAVLREKTGAQKKTTIEIPAYLDTALKLSIMPR